MSSIYYTLILYTIMTILVIYNIKDRKKLLEKIGFKKTNLIQETSIALKYLFLMFIMTFAIEGTFYLLGYTKDLELVPQILLSQNPTDLLILTMFAGFFEEIFFRGYIQRKTNILTASFLFAFFHASFGSLSEVIGVFALGLILGKEYEQTGNLFAPIMSHYLYDLIVLTMLFGIK